MFGKVVKDLAISTLRVRNQLVVGEIENEQVTGLTEEVARLIEVVNQQGDDIAILSGLVDILLVCAASSGCIGPTPGPPGPPTGRTITLKNSTLVALDFYLTVGATGGNHALPPTIMYSNVQPGASATPWDIPNSYWYSGNWLAWPHGYKGTTSGATQWEFNFNAPQYGSTQLISVVDVTTVPPGLAGGCRDGPHSACVALCHTAPQHYTDQQCTGFNMGIKTTYTYGGPVPPGPIQPAFIDVQVDDPTGDDAQAVTYPNDNASPKQQQGYNVGSWLIEFIEPVTAPTS